MASNVNLKKYQSDGFKSVEGWCSEGLFDIVDFLDSLNLNRSGGVCEIGVHHGKFFLLLNQVTDANERSFAVDVFDNQSLNIDNSGCGSAEIFKNNLALYDVHNGRNTELVYADSTDSRAASNLIERVGTGSLRFFSIDGGHSVRHTINDLQLANVLTSHAGVVFLDDILNYHWLGVIEGIVKYLLLEPTLVPFAIGHNKLLLCKLSYYDRYFKAMNAFALRTKIVTFLGTNLVAL